MSIHHVDEGWDYCRLVSFISHTTIPFQQNCSTPSPSLATHLSHTDFTAFPRSNVPIVRNRCLRRSATRGGVLRRSRINEHCKATANMWGGHATTTSTATAHCAMVLQTAPNFFGAQHHPSPYSLTSLCATAVSPSPSSLPSFCATPVTSLIIICATATLAYAMLQVLCDICKVKFRFFQIIINMKLKK